MKSNVQYVLVPILTVTGLILPLVHLVMMIGDIDFTFSRSYVIDLQQ